MDITLDGFTVKIPTDYQAMNKLPDDPVGNLSFMKRTQDAVCLAMYGFIPAKESMPFNSPDKVIAAIHGAMASDQGIIEVKNGVTESGKKYIYSLVKTVGRGGISLQYFLAMHIGFFADKVFQIQAFFNETGVTGQRESAVSAILVSDGKIVLDEKGQIVSGWTKDPYDETYTKGVLMNTGEDEYYDEVFPDHPLTQARLLINELIQLN